MSAANESRQIMWLEFFKEKKEKKKEKDPDKGSEVYIG